MTLVASSYLSREISTARAAKACIERLGRAFEKSDPACVLVYATIEHEQAALLTYLRSGLPDVPVIGCSAQGVLWNSGVAEEGYLCGVLGLGGSALSARPFRIEDIAADPEQKGRAVGRKICSELDRPPKLAIVHFDPLSGAHIDRLLDGLAAELDCPILGGGAAQPWGPMTQTYQYAGDVVLSGAAVGLVLAGDFELEFDHASGTSPTGVSVMVTHAEGNRIYRLEGRPAIEVWREVIGASELGNAEDAAAWGLGMVFPDNPMVIVRSAIGVDAASGALICAATMPTGQRLVLHHRTPEDVVNGTFEMGARMRDRIGPRKVRAVLGYECGARTAPFLGKAGLDREHLSLRQQFDADTQWFGMISWGEILPLKRGAVYANYCFPIAALAETR